MTYNPLHEVYALGSDTDVNYILHATACRIASPHDARRSCSISTARLPTRRRTWRYALNRHARGARPAAAPGSTIAPDRLSGRARHCSNSGFGMVPEMPITTACARNSSSSTKAISVAIPACFPALPELLDALEDAALPWGIVTNKAERFTRLSLAQTWPGVARALHRRRRHHAALQAVSRPTCSHACRRSATQADACIYVGDDLRDVQAGRAAGMKTAAVKWGYLGGGKPETWNADWLIDQPRDLLEYLHSSPRPTRCNHPIDFIAVAHMWDNATVELVLAGRSQRKYGGDLVSTWVRSSTGHAKVQSPCKSAGNI